ncbi:MAG TPA: hypothetical protein VFV72_02240 [Candidatus Limnocylindrales bacterium]|nr:hypothetical protein [Candidatus Limnocylindrales bacterium]
MSRTVTRRSLRLLVAGVALLGLGLTPASPVRPLVVPSAAAAEPDDGLSLVSAATYTLVPDQGLVHVSVAMTAENTKPNVVSGGVTTRYFFEAASIAVQSEATAIQATAGETDLRTRVTPGDGFTTLRVDFPSDIYFGQTVSYTVDFDLPGGAPRSDSDIRVGRAFATFYAWAFGDSGDVTISVPADFDVESSGSPTTETRGSNGVTTIAATGITDTVEWYTVVVADSHDALSSTRLDLPDGEHLLIRAWPEDEEWRNRVEGLLEIGLPVLVDKLGLPWPVDGDIEVTEVHTPLLEGYAGLFHTDENRIEISEDLDELTIIHEAAHAWFNDDLFVGRWIGEGLADEYAARVLDDVSNGGLEPNPVGPQSPGAVALNDWGPPGRIADDATEARESYGYEASWAVIRAIMREIGEDGMRKVLVAANDHRTAYVGAGEPETVGYANDWRRLLDLLEEDGGSKNALQFFRQTVVSDVEKPLLEERSAAREAYAGLVTDGDGWLPGYAIRDPMGRWQFDDAEAQIDDAEQVLETRDRIEAAAAELDLTPPPTLRAAYENAAREYDDVQRLADRILATEAHLSDASDQTGLERPPLTLLGLLGHDPDGTLVTARAAFSAGDLDAADEELAALDAMLDGAIETGRQRLYAGGGVGLAVVVLGGGALVVARRRRASRAAGPSAPVAVPFASGPAVFAAPMPVVGSSAVTPIAPESAGTLGDPRPSGMVPDLPPDAKDPGGDGT